MVDSFTDSQGNLHLQGFISRLTSITNTDKLRGFKRQVEAHEDTVTATELTEALTELDPSFSKFGDLIWSIPPSALKYFINLIMGVITLVIAYQAWQSADENHDDSIELQREQLELSREQFEYQKSRDEKQDAIDEQKLQERIESLKADFEEKLQKIQAEEPKKEAKRSAKHSLKGNMRNKACPCGSGRKAKKCHPGGV